MMTAVFVGIAVLAAVALLAALAAAVLARREARRAQQLFERTLGALPVGIEIFDRHDRLVMYNQALAEMYPYMNYPEMVGKTFADLLRISVASQFIVAARGREEQWIAERLAARRAQQHSVLLQNLAGDRWVKVYETRTPEGYVVAVRMDVADLIAQQQLLAVANDQLALLSTTDELTGIANRRRFDEALSNEWQRGARQKDPLSLLMIDIDHFKLYNDHYGHLAGDECLRQVSRLLGEGARRAGELLARYGGEEFVVLLPNTDIDLAQAIARRCMDQVRAAAIPHGRSPTAEHLTLSIGVACTVPDTARQPDALVREADAALYQAKDAGRNRVRVGEA
jgi:diguanylate cyclase (GGDEF)-like protein